MRDWCSCFSSRCSRRPATAGIDGDGGFLLSKQSKGNENVRLSFTFRIHGHKYALEPQNVQRKRCVIIQLTQVGIAGLIGWWHSMLNIVYYRYFSHINDKKFIKWLNKLGLAMRGGARISATPINHHLCAWRVWRFASGIASRYSLRVCFHVDAG